MGNKSSSCSVSDKEEELTEYDMTIYNLKKERIFWGTLAICITYAIIALILFLASFLSEKVKAILLNRFFPFTLVFVIGTIAITIYLTYQVLDFKPVKINKNNNYDNLSCPDYWRLEKVNIDESNPQHTLLFEGTNPGLFKYRCVMDTKVFDKVDIAKTKPLRITGLGQINDGLHGNTQQLNGNNPNNFLYANLQDSNNSFYVNIANSNVPASDLIKHNFIMNNYTLINSNPTTNNLKFRYNVDDATKMSIARNMNIYPLTDYDDNLAIDNNAFNAFDITNNKFMSLEMNGKTPTVKYAQTEATLDAGSGTTINNTPMACDRVYPLYLATKDVELSKGNNKLDQNVFRCAYSKICGVPWSDLNCEKYDYK